MGPLVSGSLQNVGTQGKGSEGSAFAEGADGRRLTGSCCVTVFFLALLEGVFYFLNIFSHGELPPHCTQRFLPCEVGCVRYSLQDGIMADFHSFINPGEGPRAAPGRAWAQSAQALPRPPWLRRVFSWN